jgi:hypothetical protein
MEWLVAAAEEKIFAVPPFCPIAIPLIKSDTDAAKTACLPLVVVVVTIKLYLLPVPEAAGRVAVEPAAVLRSKVPFEFAEVTARDDPTATGAGPVIIGLFTVGAVNVLLVRVSVVARPTS